MYNDAPEAGLASLLASRGRNGDSMLVHMGPEEVAGLRRLAMAHGGDLEVNPETGLYQASFLKKILPQVIGAILPSVPGVGQFTKTIGFGNEALGSALIVGGATGLIEGDLKKGLMAGLGAYSGASIASGLKAAAGVGAPAGAEPEAPTSQVSTGAAGKTIAPPSVKDQILYGGAAPRGFDVDPTRAANWAASNTPTGAAPIQAATTVKPPTSFLGTMGQGVKNIFTTPEGGSKFMEGLGGGYKSPIGQTLSRYATFAGAMLPFTEQPKAFPTGGAGGDEVVYIPGGFNPQYGTGRDQPYQLPGRYYKRTAQGLVPYNPFEMAPGTRGFATGGPVQPADQDMNQPRSIPHQNAVMPYPNRSYPLSTVTGTPYPNMSLDSSPQPKEIVGNYEPEIDAFTGEQRFADGGLIGGPILVPAYNAPTDDQNVLATRAYIEELNRRARFPYGMQGGTGMGGGVGGLGPQGLPAVTGGGTAGGGGGGGGGASVGDIVGGIAANYLINKGITSGVGYLRDKFFPSKDQIPESDTTDTTGQTTTQPTGTTPARATSSSSIPHTSAALGTISAISPFLGPKPTIELIDPETGRLIDPETGELMDAPQTTTPATSAVRYTTGSLAGISGLNALNKLLQPSPTIELIDPVTGRFINPETGELMGPAERQPGDLDADLRAKTEVGGNLSRPLSSYLTAGTSALSGLAGLANAGRAASIAIELPIYDKFGNLIGFSSAAPGAASAAGSAVSGAGSAASGTSAAGAEAAKAGTEAAKTGLGKSAILPGLQTALGAYEAFKGIQSGSESRAALGAYGLGAGLAGLGGAGVSSLSGLAALGATPVGLAAAAIAAIGASLVNTKEFGDVALRNYWNAVDAGRGIGQTNPTELAQGFINFYRTNKNEFAGQEKYGRTGNEEFVYDMTQVINNAVKNGQIDKNVDPATMYKQVVEPWLNSMGSGPQNEEAKKIQDFMMTDLINSFMQGKPISNAQIKNDSKFKIVSEKPVYAGEAPPPPSPERAINIPPAINPFGEDVARMIGDRFGQAAQIQAESPAYEPPAVGADNWAAGQAFDRSAIPSNFDWQSYLDPQINPDLRAAGLDTPEEAMRHYALYGKGEGRNLGVPAREQIIPTREEAVINPYGPVEPSPGPGPKAIIPDEYDRFRPMPMPQEEFINPYSPPVGNLTPVPEEPYYAPAYTGPTVAEEDPEFYRRAAEEIRRLQQDIDAGLADPETGRYYETPLLPPEEPVYIQPMPESAYLGPAEPFNPYSMYIPEQFRFADGGAIGDDFNFGFARGGYPGEYKAGGKLLNGPGDGMSDDIPAVIRGKGVQRAALADGEFVIPADVVSHLGNGSTKAGAKKLYDMMAKVRKARTGKTRQAPAVKTDRLLPA